MRESEFEVQTPDQVVLKGTIWEPVGEPKALVQIVHGMGEHVARYARFADVLCAHDYVVAGYDQRGHGRTAPTEADLGYWAPEDGWNKVVADARLVTEELRQRFAGLPVLVFGHSMGSYILQAYLFEHDDVAGAVFSGSTLNSGVLAAVGRPAARFERWRLGEKGVSKLLQRLSFGEFARSIKDRRTDFDWLSRDPAEVDKYIADPWCGFDVTASLWDDLSHGFLELEKPGNVARIRQDLPIRIMSGSDDPVHDGGKGFKALVKLYRDRGFDTLDVYLDEGGRHELLNETNREAIMDELRQWFDARLVETAGG